VKNPQATDDKPDCKPDAADDEENIPACYVRIGISPGGRPINSLPSNTTYAVIALKSVGNGDDLSVETSFVPFATRDAFVHWPTGKVQPRHRLHCAMPKCNNLCSWRRLQRIVGPQAVAASATDLCISAYQKWEFSIHRKASPSKTKADKPSPTFPMIPARAPMIPVTVPTTAKRRQRSSCQHRKQAAPNIAEVKEI